MGLLDKKTEAYQAACFDGDTYTGFQCPKGKTDCSLKAGDGLEISEALAAVSGQLELDHIDEARFSATRTTLPGQVVAICSDCHSNRHANDPSASRFKRR